MSLPALTSALGHHAATWVTHDSMPTSPHLVPEVAQPLQPDLQRLQQLSLGQRRRQPRQHLACPLPVGLPLQRHDSQREVRAGRVHAGFLEVLGALGQAGVHLQRGKVRGWAGDAGGHGRC